MSKVSLSDFTDENVVFQMGVEPNRIDILMGIDGVDFASAWKNRIEARYGRVAISVLSKTDLIREKRAASRPQDLLDIQRLEARSPSGNRKSSKRRPRKDTK